MDRNNGCGKCGVGSWQSLSARRAWIEIQLELTKIMEGRGRSPQGERG